MSKRKVRVVIELSVESEMTTSELEAAIWHDVEIPLSGLDGIVNEWVVSVEEVADGNP